MKRCLTLAQKGLGRVSPNPLVGCVIVKNKKIIAEGYHHAWGEAHAEIDALKKIGFKAKGATLYCNLEPCFHFGKTPPCVESVIASGIKRVVIADKDPNPKVAGQSIKLLRSKKIKVDVGVLSKEARELNHSFILNMKAKRPYVTLKMAVTLDGKVDVKSSGRGVAISGKQSQKHAHALRALSDAILVGSGTVQKDNPSLNVRLVACEKKYQPKRIVLDSSLKTLHTAKLFSSVGGDVLLYTNSANIKKKASLKKADVVSLIASGKRLPLKLVLKDLYQNQNVGRLLVEGGPKVWASFLKENLVDEVIVYLSLKQLGNDGLDAFDKAFKSKSKLRLVDMQMLGEDIYLRYV